MFLFLFLGHQTVLYQLIIVGNYSECSWIRKYWTYWWPHFQIDVYWVGSWHSVSWESISYLLWLHSPLSSCSPSPSAKKPSCSDSSANSVPSPLSYSIIHNHLPQFVFSSAVSAGSPVSSAGSVGNAKEHLFSVSPIPSSLVSMNEVVPLSSYLCLRIGKICCVPKGHPKCCLSYYLMKKKKKSNWLSSLITIDFIMNSDFCWFISSWVCLLSWFLADSDLVFQCSSSLNGTQSPIPSWYCCSNSYWQSIHLPYSKLHSHQSWHSCSY